MPAPYSLDLRTKVIEALDRGMKKTQASKIFNISRNTIDLWLKRREGTGSYQAKQQYQKGYGAKITDKEKFKEFAQKNGHLTQKEMAEAWEKDISDRTISKVLKKINFSRKKRVTVIGKGMKKKEKSLK